MKLTALTASLSPALLLLGIAAIIVLLLGLMLFLLLRTRKKQETAPDTEVSEATTQQAETQKEEKPAPTVTPAEIQPSVSSAVTFLNQNSSGRGSGYGTPWFLALGASGSGKSTLLDHSGISLSLREGAADFGIAQGIKWRFFDAGVILDVPGNFFIEADKNASDERSWKELLRNLQRYRPQRAIDGVVLTIPCTELVGDTALSPALIGQRAAHIFDKLWQIQKWLGFCYPVYVIITKCDLLPGFKSLARQLPAHYRREMFGWSNPYNLEAAFDSSWIDHGFEELARDVHRLQSEIFVERHHIPELDELFLFSRRLQELRRPLRIYLGQVFRQSAYRESLQFRGFYFCGDANEFAEEAPEPVRAMAAAASHSGPDSYLEITGDVLSLTPAPNRRATTHSPIFVTDLFEAKIFPERALAHPVARIRLSNSRMVLGTQAACLVVAIVLALGTTFGYHRLAHAEREGVANLQLISKQVKEQNPSRHLADHLDTTLAPLVVMEDLTGHHHFKSFFIPSSFFFTVDDRVASAMGPAFKDIMYAGIREELIARARKLFNEPVVASSPGTNTSITGVSIKDVPSYQNLHDFTDALLHLEENIARYNKVAEPGGGDADLLLALAKYLAGAQLQEKFDSTLKQHDSYLNTIVLKSKGERLNPSEIISPQDASEKMQDYVRAVFTEWLPPDGRIKYLDELAKKLDAFDRQEGQTYAKLNDLRTSLADAQQVLGSPEFSWINQGKVDVIAPLQDTMDRVTSRPIDQQLFLCNSSSAQEDFCLPLETLKRFIRQTGEQDLENFRTALLSKDTSLTGPLLDSQSGVLQLSPDANKVLSLLTVLLKLPFVEREGTGEIQVDLDNQHEVLWQKDELQAAIQYRDAYDNFRKGEFQAAPQNIQDAFDDVALTLLEQNMVDQVQQAERVQPLPSSSAPDQSIAPEVQSFQEALVPLNSILSAFDELDFNDAHRALQDLTIRQATHLLLRIDDSFEAQNPYARDISFDRWDGENTPTSAGFDIHNPDEMAEYLVYQRQQAQQYANLAAPVVSFLQGRVPAGGKEPGRALLKWQRIIAALQKFQGKVPGTSVAALEDFISTQINKATPDNCQAGFLTNATAQSGDYFVQTREQIRHALYNQCRMLAGQNGLQAYARIAKLFNQRLAGKFPFASPPREQMPAEADPQDVATLFKLLDSSGNAIHAALQNGSFANSYSDVLTFLNQLEVLRPLFGPMLSTEADPIPTLDFIPAFRVNQAHEINGNQIIDWSLQVGNDTFHYRDAQRVGRWSYGEPVKLTLRWAKDSPQQPASAKTAIDGKLSGRTVVFEYRDSWSLFTMLALHQPLPNDFDRLVDPEPQTLVFSVNDAKTSGSVAQPVDMSSQAKVFVRIKLRPPGKPDNLRVRTFPVEAPPVGQTQTAAQTGETGGDNQ